MLSKGEPRSRTRPQRMLTCKAVQFGSERNLPTAALPKAVHLNRNKEEKEHNPGGEGAQSRRRERERAQSRRRGNTIQEEREHNPGRDTRN